MAHQNRVTPFGDIIADPARGTWMGNRGGRLHTEHRELGTSRWKSKAWIICKLCFKGRQRTVMSPGTYTELFFLDEATALAAGHRPCFECRRRDADRFINLWRGLNPALVDVRAGDLDSLLHRERLGLKHTKRVIELKLGDVPDGAMVMLDDEAWLKLGEVLLAWSPSGYTTSQVCPVERTAAILTPATTLSILTAGYKPSLHDSAREFALSRPLPLTRLDTDI